MSRVYVLMRRTDLNRHPAEVTDYQKSADMVGSGKNRSTRRIISLKLNWRLPDAFTGPGRRPNGSHPISLLSIPDFRAMPVRYSPGHRPIHPDRTVSR